MTREKILELEKRELERQMFYSKWNLIASENLPSWEVRSMMSSVFNNKYSEGYPNRESVKKFENELNAHGHVEYLHQGGVGRYYSGCENVDAVELEARIAFQKAFQTGYHVNVQPHSGSQANMAAYMAVLNIGDSVLAMDLKAGGHLTHGSPVNFSGKMYRFSHYGVGADGRIDYEQVWRMARQTHPRLIVAGASSYSREIDFEAFGEIAQEAGALLMVDMAHIAGLVAGGVHQTPFGIADIVTMTTQKTFRGPRGGVIFCLNRYADKVDKAVFPGCQGGASQSVIAAKAVAAEEACTDDFKAYARRVVENSKAMAERFLDLGYELVSGGTDNHLFVVDLTRTHPHLTGARVADTLEAEGIYVNKQCVPDDKRNPLETSGIRIGTAFETSKGRRKEDFVKLAGKIDEMIRKL